MEVFCSFHIVFAIWDMKGVLGMKKQIRLLILGIGVILITGLSALVLGGNDEKKITDFVVTNRTELENIAIEFLSGDEKTTSYKGVEVEGVYFGEHPIVQFFYSGKGIVPASTHSGFYYSKDDVPVSFQNSEYELEAASNGEWKWDDGTDNGGVTKRITDGWFYYKVWF